MKRVLLCVYFGVFFLFAVSSVDVVDDDDSLGTWKPVDGDCGLPYTVESIVGGETAKECEFPFMALLVYTDNHGKERYLCAGSLINKRYVLTAAHCHSDVSPIQKVLFVLGQARDHGLPETQLIDVEDVTVHPDYNPRYPLRGSDIALVRLAKSVLLSYEDIKRSCVTPVCLPWESTNPGNDLSGNPIVTLSGWGKVTNDQETAFRSFNLYSAFSRTLQKLQMPILDDEVCKKNENYKRFNTSLLFCMGEKGKDSCQGDSGGPVVIRHKNLVGEPWYQIGVISFGPKECGEGIPAVYTKVTAFLEWIEENLKP